MITSRTDLQPSTTASEPPKPDTRLLEHRDGREVNAPGDVPVLLPEFLPASRRNRMCPGALRTRMGLLHVSAGVRVFRPWRLNSRRCTGEGLLSRLTSYCRVRRSSLAWVRVQDRGRRPLRISLAVLCRGCISTINLRGLLLLPLIGIRLIRVLRHAVGVQRGSLKIAWAFLPEGGSASAVTGEARKSRQKKRRANG